LDVREANSQLVNSESVIEALSQASETHQAESLKDGHDSLKTFTDATQSSVAGATGSGGNTAGGGTGNANGFKEPIMLFATPSGIGMSTQRSAHVAATEHVNIISGQSTHIATGKSLLVSVAEKISLFAQNAGMKLFAAKGKVEIQAQGDNLEITAQKTLKLLSATERIDAAAKQEILLTAGGAYVRISGGNIEIHAPGKIDIKGAQHAFSGPTSLDRTYNSEGKKADMRIRYMDAEGNVPEGEPIKLASEDGVVHNVVLDGEGKGELNGIDFGRFVADQVKRSGE
ncbi:MULTISPECIES: DUF2345 domain-containing protein, partial [Paraburkholderia]|uniref:DUF2345 domain-containing protein n=1 Tax=Paraburkholderia TaxID=1822464 RepID=UPI0038BAB8B9